MKLIIQIPCLNEEDTLAITLAALPKAVEGFDTVEWLVIDDGSTDRTVEVARENGADHVLSLPYNQGLAKAFPAGLEEAARLGADVVVNTDADNQYDASCIPALVKPIIDNQADIVIGCRPISKIRHFSPIKKTLQRIGSWAVRWASSTDVKDAPSGFRALRLPEALQLNVHNNYTYTIETIIQAGHRGFRIQNVEVKVNADLRPSRLVNSVRSYVLRNMMTILRFFVIYQPLRFFFIAAILPLVTSIVLFGRFGFFYFFVSGDGKVQSLIFAAAMLLFGVLLIAIGILGDIIAINRRLLEDIKYNSLLDRKDRETKS